MFSFWVHQLLSLEKMGIILVSISSFGGLKTFKFRRNFVEQKNLQNVSQKTKIYSSLRQLTMVSIFCFYQNT